MPIPAKRLMASHALVAAASLLGFFSAFTPALFSWHWLVAVLGLFALGAVLAPLFPRPLARMPLIILALLALIAWPFAIVIALFGSFNFNAFLAHYVQGIAGFGLTDALAPAAHVGACLAVFCLGVASLASRWGLGGLVRLAYFPLLAINPVVMETVKGAFAPRLGFDLAGMLVDPRPAPVTGPLPDILLLYLEGTEASFARIGDFAEAYRPLEALADEGIAFTGVGQLHGTDWTMAGVVASTCGLAHAIPWSEFLEQRTHGQDLFGNFACLTDFLAARGYDMATLIGADVTFAGHKTFFELHGVRNNNGRDEIRQILGAVQYETHNFGWGVDDRAIMEAGRRIYEGLGKDGRPRFFMVSTLGPHGTEGFVPPGCLGNDRALLTRDMVAALRCSLPEALRLIRAVQAMERPNGLRIIVLSDHLNHAPAIAEALPAQERHNTVLLLGGARGQRIDRAGTMVDVYPTLLQWLGLSQAPHAAGIGRSLLSDQQNLRDLASLDLLDRAMPYAPELWAAMMARQDRAAVLP